MKAGLFIIIISGIALFILLISLFRWSKEHNHLNHHLESNSLKNNNYNNNADKDQIINDLLKVLHQQNNTIVALASSLSKHQTINSESLLLSTLQAKEKEIEMLLMKQQQLEHFHDSLEENHNTNSNNNEMASSIDGISNNEGLFTKQLTPPTKFDAECESRYGLQLVETWKRNREVWCDSEPNAKLQSTLTCYPHHQTHKKLDGRGSDLFCEATNFFLDFSKISGSPAAHKTAFMQQYLQFAPGSTKSTCKRTDKYKRGLFMNHHALQMSSFEDGISLPKNYKTVDTTTYLLARDEDCENAFHSTADFMNMLLVYMALDLEPNDVQVMIFDRHPDGPFMDLINKAYSPRHPVIRNNHYSGVVLFKRIVFHLESPAGLIFPKVSRPDPMRCYSTSLFQAYRKFILKAFNLWDVNPPAIPQITLTLRHRTEHKNVGRVMANEDEVVSVLRQGNLVNVHVVDFATMSFTEQITLVRHTNVLVGIHGAGLMLIMFAAEEAVLVEIHPSYRQDRHFRHAARVTGKLYMPLRATKRETCHGSSDNVFVPIDEFRATIDGAVRLARSFDDGLSECGLRCSPALLAIDSRLNAHYKPGEERSQPMNLQFPC